MTNQIILSLGKNSWNATFVGPIRESIVRLFGCDTIPTAFTPAASADTVRKDVQDRNSDCFVTVA